MVNDDNIKTIAQREIQDKYERKMKKLEIQQKNELYKSSFMLYSVFTIAGIVFIFTIIIYYFYRAKTKANKELIAVNNEIKNQKNELSNLNEKLHELNNTKDKFFSIIAHDLRNPLGNFKEIANLMTSSNYEMDEAEKKEFLDLIKDSANNLYSLLENLLEWSRSQRGIMQFNPNEFDLYLLAQNNINMLKFSADSKNIRIISNIKEGTNVTVDGNMIITVIRNLVSNAIKFTPDGGNITINSSNGDKEIIISVSDSGVGIPQSLIDKLFRIDQQVTSIGTNEETGTGLGLILCKEFVEKHGGKIWVESEVGKGSTFYFTIPHIINSHLENINGSIK
jgi:signal transduction histidine kinase